MGYCPGTAWPIRLGDLNYQEVYEMRNLTNEELGLVAGGVGACTPADAANNIGGVTSPGSLGQDLIDIYEGLVSFTSHMMERVANAF